MAEFARGLSNKALGGLAAMTAAPANWWRDLLNAWAPAGTALSQTRQLRLAVRDGYLNFYHSGQSVAEVSFDGKGTPRLRTHIKYVVPGAKEQAYVTLTGETFRLPPAYSHVTLRYPADITLADIVAGTRPHVGLEKSGVEAIVARHAAIIDLEMGLPAWEGQPLLPLPSGKPRKSDKYALRMDMIALERHSDGALGIVFWEAKTVRDARLRKAGADLPEVAGQLSLYKDYLSDAGRAATVVAAYRRNCQTLLQLHELMRNISTGATPELGSLIVEAAQADELRVDVSPRLAIFNNVASTGIAKALPKTWAGHLGKLSSVPLRYAEDAALLELGPITSTAETM